MSKFEACIECNSKYSLNAKGLCPDCVFKKNHNGKSQTEVYLERQKIKQNNKIDLKVNIIHQSKKKPSKKGLNLLRSERLDKRKEIVRRDEELYEYIFNKKPNFCEECEVDLPSEFRDEDNKIIARWQYSHILSKGAFPEYRYHKKNMNRLCFSCHQEWEFGERETMKIFRPNNLLIQEMRDETERNRVSN